MEDERVLEYWERRLYDLTSTRTYTTGYDVRGGDVYGGDKKTITKGTKEEIKEASENVAKYRALVAQRKRNMSQREDESAIANYSMQSKQDRAHAFRQAKKRYKDKSIFTRAINKISGKAPNWKKIEQNDLTYNTSKLNSMYAGGRK